MTKKLFLISTPSQAFFLNQSPELINKAVLVIAVPNKKLKSKILVYLSEHKWDSIVFLKIPQNVGRVSYLKIFYFRLWLTLFKKKYPSFSDVFVGSYNNHYNISIIGEYEAEANIHLLYDGMQMIAVSQNRRENEKGIRPFPSLFEILRFKKAKINKLDFIGPLPLQLSGKDSYTPLKRKMSYSHPIPENDKVIFVGQPLIGTGVVNEEFYFRSLLMVKEKFPGKQMIYAPHPRERIEDIEEIRKIMDIAVFSEIFEEKFITSEKFPGTVITFYSSVLLNLCYLQAKINLFGIEIPYEAVVRKDLYENYKLVLKYIEEVDYPYLNFLNLENKKKNPLEAMRYEK